MSDAILFIAWDRPHLGQDEKAMGYLTTEGLAYLEKLKGTYFERFEMIGLTAHGSDLNFAVLLHGKREKLDELRRTDDFEAFSFKLSSFFARLRVVPGLSLEGLRKVMARMTSTRG